MTSIHANNRRPTGVTAGRPTLAARCCLAAAAFTAATLLSGCALFPVEKTLQEPPLVFPEQKPKLATVTRADVVYELKFSGSVRSAREVVITFAAPGRIHGIFAKGGDRVDADALLVQLDDGEARLLADQAEIALRRAHLRLKEFDATHGGSADALRQVQRSLLELDVEAAEKTLAYRQQQAAAAQVRAPFAGVVTSITQARPGEGVAAGAVAATVADPARLVIQVTELSDGLLRWLKPGQPAKIKTGVGAAASTTEGTVLSVPLSGAGITPAARVVTLTYTGLTVATMGTPVEVRVEVERAENVLTVPVQAILSDGARRYVLVPTEAGRKEVYVEVGLSDGIRTQILSGLNEGEQVILS